MEQWRDFGNVTPVGTRVIGSASGVAAAAPRDAGHPAEPADEEPLFLDEPAAAGPLPAASDPSSVFDLFADENDAASGSVPATDPAAGRSSPGIPPASLHETSAARGRMPRSRLVALFLLAAAFAFAGVRACQISAEVSHQAIDVNP